MVCSRAHHQHLVRGSERHDAGLDAEHGVGTGGARFLRDPAQGEVPRRIENVRKFLDLAPRHGFQRAENAARHTDGIAHIADDEFFGRIPAIEQAIEFLAVAAGRIGFFGYRRRAVVHARTNGQELDIALHRAQFAGHAGYAVSAILLRLGNQPVLALVPPLADDRRNLRDLATECGLEAGSERAEQAQRMHTVADHQFAGRKALQIEAEHLVARQTCHHRHGRLLGGWLRS